MLWLTFPPMVLLFMDRPFGLIVAYGALGPLFMPFLALALLWLLNSRRTPPEWRSRWLSNGMLAAGGGLFCALAGRELMRLFGQGPARKPCRGTAAEQMFRGTAQGGERTLATPCPSFLSRGC